jgi:hypothetical protein
VTAASDVWAVFVCPVCHARVGVFVETATPTCAHTGTARSAAKPAVMARYVPCEQEGV